MERSKFKEPRLEFRERAVTGPQWVAKGWQIALHGYDHVCTTKSGGMNPVWNRSEFAGLAFKEQCAKIQKGLAILHSHQLYPHYFFAPSHTFDEQTIEALRSETDIRIISDTYGRWPYKKNGFWFIPQIAGHCMRMPLPGIYTFCFHPNTMNETAFHHLESFLSVWLNILRELFLRTFSLLFH